MADGSEEEKRTKLHNFGIPSNLRWGHQRKLRAMKVPCDDIPSPPLHGRHFPTDPVVNCTGATPANHHPHHQLEEQQPSSGVPFSPKSFVAKRCQNDNATARSPAAEVRRIPCSTTPGASAVSVGETSTKVRLKITDSRSKNKNNNKSSEDQSKVHIPQDKEENKEPRLVSRPRRACAAALYKGGTFSVSHLLCGKNTSRGASETTGNVGGGYSSSDQPVRFKISLSKDEIASDFLLMTGEKPPRKPKKRPRLVQQHLKALYPASVSCFEENLEIGKLKHYRNA